MWKRIRRDLGKTGESFWIPENLEIKEKGNRMERREIYTKITEKAETMKQELVKIRRDFHRYPELGWMEMRTSSIIASYLKRVGCDEVLVGRDVCLDEARMGLPADEVLDRHYEEAATRRAQSLRICPIQKVDSPVWLESCAAAKDRRWHSGLIWTRCRCWSARKRRIIRQKRGLRLAIRVSCMPAAMTVI